jgi:hypothetical protein
MRQYAASPRRARHWFSRQEPVWLGFSVTPAKVFAHAKGDPFGATTHKFRRDGQSR